jgi:hypothetical protein
MKIQTHLPVFCVIHELKAFVKNAINVLSKKGSRPGYLNLRWREFFAFLVVRLAVRSHGSDHRHLFLVILTYKKSLQSENSFCQTKLHVHCSNQNCTSVPLYI